MNTLFFQVTQDYVVIMILNFVWFCRRSHIKAFKEGEKNVAYYEVPIKKIPIENMFDRAATYESGIRILHISPNDMSVISNATGTKDKKNTDQDWNTIKKTYS